MSGVLVLFMVCALFVFTLSRLDAMDSQDDTDDII